ncbi:peptide ABC transporter ATP-binding protein [Aureimonas sp. SA4125]|uniref:DMT family transporter n=1 Tax=Aureimonas sp. SA4125 TaxID=2826993 RepID=UPI001CC56FB6|nr:DMT family transporter [Aureimonas sp. SA4125]BDA86160.1 peptide ABC transporter ATP-binding protein [Aureimonas sp. SA4125]
MPRLLPYFPAIFVVLWSTGFIGARYAMPHAEPFSFLALRFALALVLLSPVAFMVRGGWPGRRPALHAMFAGGLIHGVYLGGVFFAVRHGLSAGIAALIVGLQPLLTALLAAAFLGETIRPRHWLGLALGLLGVALVVAPKLGTGAGLSGLTLLPALLAALAISVGTIWQKRFVGGVDLRVGTALQYLGALVPMAFCAVAFESFRVDVTAELVFALVWLTFVLSIGAVFLLLFLIREGAVSEVSSLMYLTPGVTACMAFLLFGETLAPIQLAGMVLAAAGVAAATWKRDVPPVSQA